MYVFIHIVLSKITLFFKAFALCFFCLIFLFNCFKKQPTARPFELAWELQARSTVSQGQTFCQSQKNKKIGTTLIPYINLKLFSFQIYFFTQKQGGFNFYQKKIKNNFTINKRIRKNIKKRSYFQSITTFSQKTFECSIDHHFFTKKRSYFRSIIFLFL